MEKSSYPLDRESFSHYIKETQVAEKTLSHMKVYLTNWYKDFPEDFRRVLQADLDEVLQNYHFPLQSVALVKNFNFDPPFQDYLHCFLDIESPDGYHHGRYQCIYNPQLEAVDDKII